MATIMAIVPRRALIGQAVEIQSDGRSEVNSNEMSPPGTAFLVSTTPQARQIESALGSAAYSYHFVAEAIARVLERLGTVRRIDHPESQLAWAAAEARNDGYAPVHIAVQPLQDAYLESTLQNIVFPFWEFPDLPDRPLGGDPRQNWVRIANRSNLILTACRFTAATFSRSAIRAPVAVVPVPSPSWLNGVPEWSPHDSQSLTCRWTELGVPSGEVVFEAPSSEEGALRRRVRGIARRVAPWLPPEWEAHAYRAGRALRSRSPVDWIGASVRTIYKRSVRDWLSDRAIARVSAMKHATLTRLGRSVDTPPEPRIPRRALELAGLTYTSFLSVGDPRKNYGDLLSAFVHAFRDDAHASLVIKLATNARREAHELSLLRAYHRALGIDHRCRVLVITDYLDDAQLAALMQATTYYVNTSYAEGACLPLQDALAAGRPAIAPDHSAMRDYMDRACGFVVGSNPEPCAWPHDPEQRLETYRGRIRWSDLRDHFRESADVARYRMDEYRAMSIQARQRLSRFASLDSATEAMARALMLLSPRALAS